MFFTRIFVTFTLLLFCLAGMAQDVIVCKDGVLLHGKVAEVTDIEVKYRKADNPDGPLYTLKVADLLRINYENGQSDIFAQDSMAPVEARTNATGDIKDTYLLSVYKKDQSYSFPKKLKLTAFIGGGVLIATGVTLLIVGSVNAEGFRPVYEPGLFISGFSLTAAGIVWMPTFYLIARHKEKKLNELASAPIYRKEIFTKDGKSLSMGVDFLADRMKTRTLGIGMTLKF